jgi:hypothetical protein
VSSDEESFSFSFWAVDVVAWIEDGVIRILLGQRWCERRWPYFVSIEILTLIRRPTYCNH